MVDADPPLPDFGAGEHAAAVWARFIGACQKDPELGPYVGTILGLASAVLGDPTQNLAVLDRIAGHLNAAREQP